MLAVLHVGGVLQFFPRPRLAGSRIENGNDLRGDLRGWNPKRMGNSVQ